MKSSSSILVIDLGLTNCKAVVFSACGEIIAKATTQYPTSRSSRGEAEQDPNDWWKAACSAVRSIWENDPELRDTIDAISVTGQMHALVCLDNYGEPLHRAIILSDRRGMNSASQINAEMGMERIYKITGTRMDSSLPAAKIRWMKAHKPDIHKQTGLFLGCKDYIRGLLTGDRFTDPIDACATSLYDIHGRSWSSDLMKLVGIRKGQLPIVRNSYEIAGNLLKESARALNLKPNIPVVVGGGDDVTVLGNGLMKKGRSLESIGTTGGILAVSEEAYLDPEMSLEICPHAKPGLWVFGGAITAAGIALEWASKVLKYESIYDAFKVLEKTHTEPRSNLPIFIPHLLGERCPSWNNNIKGMWTHLSADTSNEDLMLTVFEGIAFALKTILVRIENLVGQQDMISIRPRDDEHSDWMHLRADIYERSLGVVNTTETSAFGAMILASVGIGVYGDLDEAVEKLTRIEKVISPNKKRLHLFRNNFSKYTRAHDALLPIWDEKD